MGTKAMTTDPDAVDPRLVAYFERAGDAGLDGSAEFPAEWLGEVAPGSVPGAPAAVASDDAPLPADIGAL